MSRQNDSSVVRAALPVAQMTALERVMAIAEFAPDGTLLRANDHYLSLLGVRREDAIGRPHRSFCPPAFAGSEAYAAFWSGLCAGAAHSGLAERVRSDGSSCWLEATYAPVHDDDGQLRQILKVATDISARLRHEREQQEHLQRLSLIADASNAAIMISDSTTRIVHVNSGFTRMFGWSTGDIAGQAPGDLLVPQKGPAYVEAYRLALQAGESVEREEIVVGKENQRYWAKIISNPIFDA